MTVYVLIKSLFASHHYPQNRTNCKGVYDSMEKAWEAIERDYYSLLKIIEETKYTIRGVRIDCYSHELTIEYENFIEDFYFCETFDIIEAEIK